MKCIFTEMCVYGATCRIDQFTGYINCIVVENDVRLIANGFVKQGYTGHSDTAFGARTLVMEGIPPYSIAVGIPAKVIGYQFEPQIIYRLIESKLREMPLNGQGLCVRD